jgi:hypothetical protein
MYGYFTFELSHPRKSRSILAIFCATATPTIDEVTVALRKYSQETLPADAILLIAMETERNVVQQIAASQSVLDCLPKHTPDPRSNAVSAVFIPRNGLSEQVRYHEVTWGEIQQAALLTIFKRRNTLLIAPPTYHFAKPSRKHAKKFIRAANALVDGAEITFIAACLLSRVEDTVRHFYCDTGGIAVVAFAVDSLRRRFNPTVIAASVNTFESYGGLENFSFRDLAEAMILLSASTSGEMEKCIRRKEHQVDGSRIITLFSINQRPLHSFVLLDLELDLEHRQQIGEFISHSDDACPLCRQGSIPVPMTGDQFLPARSETISVEMKRTDAPPWLERFLSATAGSGVLRAFYRNPHSRHAASLVFVDMEKVYALSGSTPLLRKRIDRMINQAVPVSATRLLHLDDPSSLALAELVKSKLRELRRDHLVLELRPICEVSDLSDTSAGATVIVAGAIASGQSLLAASRILRDLQTEGSISYLVGLSRMPTAKHLERHEGNLRMGESAMDYGICIAERIHLPLNGRFSQTSWDEEIVFLSEIADELQRGVRQVFEERISLLHAALSNKNRGMADGLFWRSHREEELRIRKGFVFLPKSVDAETFCLDSVSQGDVFFSVVAVLHNMRFGNGPKSVLHQTEYRRSVLAASCFNRFSDGVIQASLLRAANRPELDYSSAAEESHTMTGILRSTFSASMESEGEASREFLLAIALERLVLCRSDLVALYDEFSSSCKDEVAACFWDVIKKRQLGE